MGGSPRIAGVALILALLLGACATGGSSSSSSSKKPDRQLLPAALADPGGAAGPAADALAAKVVRGGPSGAAALRTALHRGGVALIDLDATVVDRGASPQQGLYLVPGEVLLATNRPDLPTDAISLVTVMQGLAGIENSAHADPVAMGNALLADLRAGPASGKPTLEFYNDFIAALGRVSPAADTQVDLLDPKTQAGSVTFDRLQAALVMLRASTDAVLAAKAKGQTGPSSVMPVAFRSGSAIADSSQACTLSPAGGTAMDAVYTAFGSAWSALSNFASEGGTPLPGLPLTDAEKAGGALLLKIFLLLEAFKPDFVMEEGEPLQRTKDKNNPGEQKKLKLTVNFDSSATQYLNCFRIIFARYGADVGAPTNGPGANILVNFHMKSDGPDDATQFHSLPDYPYVGDGISVKTDKDGIARTGLEGKPQGYDVDDFAIPVDRTVLIYYDLNLKTANMVQDLVDAMGVFTTTVQSGPLAGLAAFLSTLLDRIGFLSGQKVFRVKDWGDDFKIDASWQYSGCSGDCHVTALKCHGAAGAWNTDYGSFSLDSSGQGTFPGDNPAQMTLSKGNPAQLHIENQFAVQQVQVQVGKFCK